MRKITNESVNAFNQNYNFSKQNMRIESNEETTKMYLHNNLIAVKNRKTGKLEISSANWETVTTKERLNALPGVNIHQKNFVWFLNGEIWKDSSKLTPIN